MLRTREKATSRLCGVFINVLKLESAFCAFLCECELARACVRGLQAHDNNFPCSKMQYLIFNSSRPRARHMSRGGVIVHRRESAVLAKPLLPRAHTHTCSLPLCLPRALSHVHSQHTGAHAHVVASPFFPCDSHIDRCNASKHVKSREHISSSCAAVVT